MTNYSQGSEQSTILNYFGERAKDITFLDIGANDGISLSNSYALSLISGKGLCVEPSPEAYAKLFRLHNDKPHIECFRKAIGEHVGTAAMFDSGSHLNTGDTSLLSTIVPAEYEKWKDAAVFTEIEVDVIDFATLLSLSNYKQFQFISIDAEGMDLTILKQMDLTALGCELLCIEWNTNKAILWEIKRYCEQFGLTNVLLKNGENVILAK